MTSSCLDQSSWNGRKLKFRLPDGRSISYIDTGGSDPVLVLVHGYSDSSRSYSMIEPWLGRYRLIIPDLPGHGESALRTGWEISELADDIARLIAQLGSTPLAVVGHSLGAMIALELAARPNFEAGKLVTISGTLAPRMPSTGPLGKQILRLSDPIDSNDPFFADWHAGPKHVDPDFLKHLSIEAAAIPAAVWQAIFSELSRLDLTAAASQISVPLLCISGSEDELFDASHRQHLLKALPDAKSIVMDGFGHNPHWEDPAKVASDIDSFIRAPNSKSR